MKKRPPKGRPLFVPGPLGLVACAFHPVDTGAEVVQARLNVGAVVRRQAAVTLKQAMNRVANAVQFTKRAMRLAAAQATILAGLLKA